MEGEAMYDDLHEETTWQRYDLYTMPNGTIRGECATNDNLDHGYPSESARWEVRYRDYAQMLKLTGGSHVGCIGCQVRVFLDGKAVKKG